MRSVGVYPNRASKHANLPAVVYAVHNYPLVATAIILKRSTVPVLLRACGKPQIARLVDAGIAVAVVNLHSFWNWAEVSLPSTAGGFAIVVVAHAAAFLAYGWPV